ncbi:riboflavin synthase [soil metagenome]
MFTGIIEELGRLTAAVDLGSAARLTISGPVVTADAEPGDSIAVNGVCLTLATVHEAGFTADVMQETLRRSALGALGVGDRVNLERAVTAHTRLGGHLVQGHIDGTATVLDRRPAEHWEILRFGLPAELGRYVVEKGSITVDGVSLTVSVLGPDWFEVSLIPTTLAHTTLGRIEVGDPVNLEVDIIAKYVEKLLAARTAS